MIARRAMMGLLGDSGGGGEGSGWELIGENSFRVSSTSTTASVVGTVDCGAKGYTGDHILWIHIRGQAGKRSGYFYGTDAFIVNTMAASGRDVSCNAINFATRISTNGAAMAGAYGSDAYGVYATYVDESGIISISRRYHSSNSLTLNDTFDVKVYRAPLPTGEALFE